MLKDSTKKPAVMKLSEKDIERAILDLLATVPGLKCWKANVTGIYDPTKKIFRKPVGPHSANGCPDIIGVYKGRMLALEVKTKTGTVKPHQEQFIRELRQCGAIAYVVRSLDDVIALLKTLRQDIDIA